MASKTLAFFALPSPDGRALADAVAQTLGPKHGFEVTVKYGAKQDDFFQAALADDVVVADATLVGEEENNYPAFTLQQISFDHILMVSRSYVPLNLLAMQEGGIPPYPVPKQHPPEFAQSNQGKGYENWGNPNIIAWLDQKLAELQAPRSDKIAYIPGETGFEMLDTYLPQMRLAMERAEQRKRQEYQVFISYRSRYQAEVEGLVKDLKAGRLHNGQPKKALYFLPGSLAYETELVPKMRRWMLLAILDRRLASCEEFIIFNKTDDKDPSGNYLNSWWTQGELMTIAYRRAAKPMEPSGDKAFQIKVSLYDPSTKTLSDGEHLIPKMTEAQVARMARYYAHSDPLTLGPESTEGIRGLRKLFNHRWLGWLVRWQFKRRANDPRFQELMRQAYPLAKITEGEVSTDEVLTQVTDINKFRKFIDDEVFSDEFLYYPILEAGSAPHPAHEPPDVDAFLSMGEKIKDEKPTHHKPDGDGKEKRFMYEVFKPTDLEQAMQRGLNSKEGKQYKMVSGAEPRCLWYPSRMGQERKECFEVLPVYASVPMSKQS